MSAKLWDVTFCEIIPATREDPHGRMVYYLFSYEGAARVFAGRRGQVKHRVWGKEFIKGRGVIDHRRKRKIA